MGEIVRHPVAEYLAPFIGSHRTVHRADQRDREVQTTGPAFVNVVLEVSRRNSAFRSIFVLWRGTSATMRSTRVMHFVIEESRGERRLCENVSIVWDIAGVIRKLLRRVSMRCLEPAQFRILFGLALILGDQDWTSGD